MVNPLINDGHLIGFWPLHEPSGAASFHNYSPRVANKPSGISFDFTVHDCQNVTSQLDEARTPWPGSSRDVLIGTSGVPYVPCYKAQGQYNGPLGAVSTVGRVLVLGDGDAQTRAVSLAPRIAQSGITVGFWVSPQSSGLANYIVAASGSHRTLAKLHSLMQLAEDDHGFILGVSGVLTEAAQNAPASVNPRVLSAFFLNLGGTTAAGNANEVHLNTPIESGKFTHMTLEYRILVDTTNNNTHAFALYKDGVVAASGQRTGVSNTVMPVLNVAELNVRAWTIGGSLLETDRTDRYANATGNGHLISGVYLFNRPLSPVEIGDLHGAGGFQPFEGIAPQDATEILFSDSKLLAHYTFQGPGFADISPNRHNLITVFDEGNENAWVTAVGPFGKMGVLNYGAATPGTALGSTSGLVNALIENKSFSIAGCFAVDNSAIGNFPETMVFSLGQVTSTFTGAPSEASMCFYVCTDGQTNTRWIARFFPLGIHNVAVTNLRGGAINGFAHNLTHIGIAYDDQTRGVALYTNGVLQESGTLAHSLSDQVTRVANSGFPLVFLNGVQTSIIGDASPYNTTSVGAFCSDLVVMGRPLQQQEFLFLAKSGIAPVTSILRTRQDPRLIGYWKANLNDPQTVIVPDLARTWQRNPANLVRGTNGGGTTSVWSNIEVTDNQGPWYRRDEFGQIFAPPAALNGDLPLGITSGTWVVAGGSLGIDFSDADTDHRSSSVANLVQRFKPFIEQRTTQPTTPFSYLIGFDVLPSGNIRALTVGDVLTTRHNALLHYLGTESADEAVYSYLTRNAHTVGQNVGSSGVTIVFEGRDGAAVSSTTPLASGNLSFGVHNKVLFRMGFVSPYYFGDANGAPLVRIELFVNGVRVYQRTATATSSRAWSDGTVGTADTHVLQFGGIAAERTVTTNVPGGEVGLGQIYLRNMFVLKGNISNDDTLFFAASGIIDTTPVAGYSDTPSMTAVDANNASLEGYYRFAGGMSGELDLSLKHNDLIPLAAQGVRTDIFSSKADNPAQNLRFVPGPLKLSDLGVQASGIGYEANTGGFTGNVVPPFIASGAPFERPDLGFTVGLLVAKRASVASVHGYDPLISFGVMPTAANIPLPDFDRSWAIVWDSSENLKMVISQSGTGSMYFTPTTADVVQSGTVVCGAFTDTTTALAPPRFLDSYDHGKWITPGHIDSWNHYLWSYDATTRYVTCYMNGERIDESHVSSGIQLPVNPTTRIISFLISQTSAWNWANASTTSNDIDSFITDVCYFSAPITAAQARYIAFNGIDAAVGTETSGVVGGYIQGQDTGSGLIGGWLRGHDTGSGLIGGYSPGGNLGSGEPIGGYVSGIIFAEGTLGGFVRGLDTGSGIIAGFILGSDLGSGRIGGYVRALDIGSGLIGAYSMGGTVGSGLFGGFIPASAPGSGLIGGFITGGLRGFFSFDSSYTVEVLAAKDFDSQLEIAKTTSADFDAKLIIFQDESPPLVAIEIPGSTVTGLVPPFNQYFIGRASGVQGKTITQTRWNFGDFTPPVAGSLSGTSHYPIQHRFAGSGFYIVKFEAIDSNGLHASDTRIINAVSGVDPVVISLSGVPRSGNAALLVDFDTNVDILPPGVSIITQLLNFDDGQTTTAFDPTHAYTEPGTYKPVWMVRDSRGIIWCDGLKMGSDILTGSED